MISLDTETTGFDTHHGAKPFFVTTCDEAGDQKFWQWDVDPLTREPDWSPADVDGPGGLCEVLGNHDVWVLQNPKFDFAALATLGMDNWPWPKVVDTLLAGHLLASNRPHDLTSMALQYVGVDIEPLEKALEQAVQACRRWVRANRPTWRIASKGLSDMPSAKEKTWKSDTWLPRVVAREMGLKQPAEECNHQWGYQIELPATYQICHRCLGNSWWTVLRDYANGDSEVTLLIWKAQQEEINRRGLGAIYQERLKALPVAYAMEKRGVTLNRDRLTVLQTSYGQLSAQAEDRCVQIANLHGCDLQMPKGAAVNASLRRFMFDVLQLPPMRGAKSKTDAPTLDKEAMAHYAATLPVGSSGLDFVQTLLVKRERDKALAAMDGYVSFLLPLPHVLKTTKDCGCKGDGRCPVCDGGLSVCKVCGKAESELDDLRCGPWHVLHPNLNPTGTDTLRWSSSNPNAQNISKQKDAQGVTLRTLFGPAPGREWWSLDAQNIERRIPAYEAGEADIIALFERPNDPPYYGSEHLLVCHLLHKELFEACRGEDREVDGRIFKKRHADTWYQWTKNFNFAVQYGCQEAKGDATARVRGAWAKVKSRFRAQEALNQKLCRMADRLGYVETIPDEEVDPKRGYPLLCTRSEWGRISPTIPLSYHVQGTACWWMMRAMVKCQALLDHWRRTDAFDGHITLQVHDELVFDLPAREDPVADSKIRGGRGPLVRTQKTSNLWRMRELQATMASCGDAIGVPTPVGVEYHRDSWGEGATLT